MIILFNLSCNSKQSSFSFRNYALFYNLKNLQNFLFVIIAAIQKDSVDWWWWPCWRDPARVKRRHCSNVYVDWIQTVLYVELFENLDHLFHEKGSSLPPFSHILVVHSVSHPYWEFQCMQVFKIHQYYCWWGVPVFTLVLNVTALLAKERHKWWKSYNRVCNTFSVLLFIQSMKWYLPCYSLLHHSNLLYWCGNMDIKIDRIAHIWTTIVIAYWLCRKSYIRI